jgi:hypothetical protein
VLNKTPRLPLSFFVEDGGKPYKLVLRIKQGIKTRLRHIFLACL